MYVKKNIKIDNPREGTETEIMLTYNIHTLIKIDNPREGTETTLPFFQALLTGLIKIDNPREGTETRIMPSNISLVVKLK